MRIPHLDYYAEETAFGPIQREEALLLFALTRVLRPKVLVEFGFLCGHSARNFLVAMDPDARLYSFDIDKNTYLHKVPDERFCLIYKSQDAFDWSDVGYSRS